MLVWTWRRLDAKAMNAYSVPIASGLIAGESLMKAILAMLVTELGLVASGS